MRSELQKIMSIIKLVFVYFEIMEHFIKDAQMIAGSLNLEQSGTGQFLSVRQKKKSLFMCVHCL